MKQNTNNSIIIILIFLLSVYGKRILGYFVDVSFNSPILRLIYSYSWWIIPVIISVGALYGFRNIALELRIQKGFLFALGFAAIMVSPMFISSAINGKIDPELTFLDIFHKSALAGFMEELLFRGFLVGLLFRKLKWGFIPATLVGAVVFGLGHLYQGESVNESIGIFMITFIGSAWFGWLFIEWNENLWIPILLHTFMNLSWSLFDVGGNALGDNSTNLFRTITIILTVVTTIIYNLKKSDFTINRKNLLLNR